VLSVVYDSSRALRLSLGLVVLLSLGILCVGVLVSVPQARLQSSLQVVSDTWTRLFAGAPGHSGPLKLVNAGATSGQAANISGSPTVSTLGASGAIVYGDRLKVAFLESVGVTLSDSGSQADSVVAAVFPRMDLTGEYVVDEDGSLNIPKLGQFATTGQTIKALQSELAAAFQRAIGRTSDVSVVILERKPIYVLGPVRNAGTFKHTPGMIVLQALADAGGLELGAADTSRAIESIRETERLRQGKDRFDRLLVRQARLIAQRDGLDTITLPADIRSRMSETLRQNGLNGLVAAEVATLNIERRSYQQLMSLAERQVSIAQAELQAQNLRVTQLKTVSAKKASQIHDMAEIAARGSVSQYKLADANIQLSELVSREEDLHVSVAQAEGRLAEVEMAQAKIELGHSAEINRELATTQQDIDEAAQAVASIQAVTEVLRTGLPKVAGEPASEPASRTGFRITRRVTEGLTVISATETTALVPGDILQVAPIIERALTQR
jgi:exopolysaccharide production protein ExoF